MELPLKVPSFIVVRRGAVVVGFAAGAVVFVLPGWPGAVVFGAPAAWLAPGAGLVPPAGTASAGPVEPAGSGPFAACGCVAGSVAGLLNPALAPTSRTVPAAVPMRAIRAR